MHKYALSLIRVELQQIALELEKAEVSAINKTAHLNPSVVYRLENLVENLVRDLKRESQAPFPPEKG
jgi:hypothetical protein